MIQQDNVQDDGQDDVSPLAAGDPLRQFLSLTLWLGETVGDTSR